MPGDQSMIRVPLSAQEGPDHGDSTSAGLPPAPLLLKPADVATMLGLAVRRPDQVLRRLQAQGLRVLKLDGHLMVRPAELHRFLAAAEAAEADATAAVATDRRGVR